MFENKNDTQETAASDRPFLLKNKKGETMKETAKKKKQTNRNPGKPEDEKKTKKNNDVTTYTIIIREPTEMADATLGGAKFRRRPSLRGSLKRRNKVNPPPHHHQPPTVPPTP